MDQSLKRELERLLFSEEERILGVLGVEGGKSDGELVISDEVLNGGKCDISVLPHTGSVEFPLHRHSFLEMMLVLSGSIVHRIADKRITLGEGSILFLNKHLCHSVDAAKAGDVALNVIISDRFAESVRAELSATVFADLLKENANQAGEGVYLHFCAKDKLIENLKENLLIELTSSAPRIRILTKTVELLMTHLSLGSDEYLCDASAPTDKDKRRRLAISAYIKDNYRTATLTELSERLYVSAPYLSKIVKEYFGKSFKELLIEERVERAKKLLSDTDIPIGDVIQSVGYENDSYFHREFKKLTGSTPLALRKQKNGNICK